MKHRTGHLFKRGSNFYVQWRVDGKLHMKALRDEAGQAITTIREAEQARDRFMAPMALTNEADSLKAIAEKSNTLETKLSLEKDVTTIANAWSQNTESVERPTSGAKTLRQYSFQWGRFEDWMAEHHPKITRLNQVTKDIAEQYLGTLNHGTLSPNTYNKHLNLLKLVFRVLKDKAGLTVDPWESFVTKDLQTNSRRELSVDKLRELYEKAEGELRTLILIGALTGLRLGDAATLRWCEVDFRRGIIDRVPNKTSRKYPNRKVKVPLHPTLREALESVAPDQRGEYVLPDTATLYLQRSDLVTDRIQRHFKACGINIWKPGTGKDGTRAVIEYGFHSLRHSFVGLCADSGVPLAVVQKLVGHGSPAMTDHYLNVPESTAVRAVAALPVITVEAQQGEPKRTPEAILAAARGIVEGITAKTWKVKREELLALLTV